MNSSIRSIVTIAKREFLSYFTSPIAYVFLVIFLLMSGGLTFMLGHHFFARNEASLDSFFGWHAWLFLFLVPAVAMRLWSEEKRTGTIELLLTMPVTPAQATVGKFLASWAFILLALALTFPLWMTAADLGDPDNGAIFCAYLGSGLMAGAFLAIGCMTSALTRNQVVSFILSVSICLVLILCNLPPVIGFIEDNFPGNMALKEAAEYISFTYHFDSVQRGVVYLKNIVYFLSIISLALFTTAAIIGRGQEARQKSGLGMSVLQTALLAVALILLNAICFNSNSRADFTEHKIYTLSDGTKNIISRLVKARGEDPDSFKLEARLYYTTNDHDTRIAIKGFANQVDELLREFAEEAQGSIIYKNIDPQPDTDEQDVANQDSVVRIQIGEEEFIYLGLTLSYADKNERVELWERSPDGRPVGLRPTNLLEYEIASAITRLLPTEEERPVIGIMSPLQLNGGFPPGLPPQMMRQQRPAPPWMLMRILNQSIGQDNVRTVDMGTHKIDDDIDLLLVVHPKGIHEGTQFALDQYVLGGGKMAVFMDPNFAMDQPAQGNFSAGGSKSTLDKLLPAWGLHFTDDKVLADKNYGQRMPQGGGLMPTMVNLQIDDIDSPDPIVQNLGPVCGVHFGEFMGNPKEDKGLDFSVLLQSSKQSAMILSDQTKPLIPFPSFQQSQSAINRDFNGTDTERMLAVKLSGAFKTAFPQGDPEALPADDNATKPADNALKSVKEGANPLVVLIGDVDMLHDINPQLDQLRGFQNSNFNFVLNLIDYLTGDEDLMRIRGLSNRSRPLTKLNELEEKATADIQAEIDALIKKREEKSTALEDVEREIEEKRQQAIQSGSQFIELSEESSRKIAETRKKTLEEQEELAKSIRNIRKKRTAAANSIRNRIKWRAITFMPALVCIIGLIVCLRFGRTTAQSPTKA